MIVPFLYRGDASRRMRIVIANGTAGIEEQQGVDMTGGERWHSVDLEEARGGSNTPDCEPFEWVEMVALAVASATLTAEGIYIERLGNEGPPLDAVLAENLRAGDVLVNEGRTMVIDRVGACVIGGPLQSGMPERLGVGVVARGGRGITLSKGQTVSILRRPEPAKPVGAMLDTPVSPERARRILAGSDMFTPDQPAVTWHSGPGSVRQAPEVVTVNRKAISLQFPAATPASVQDVLFDIADVLELISSTAWAIEDLPAEVAAAKAVLS